MKCWIPIFAFITIVSFRIGETKYLLLDVDKNESKESTRLGICGAPCEKNGDCFDFHGWCFLCDFPGRCSSFRRKKMD